MTPLMRLVPRLSAFAVCLLLQTTCSKVRLEFDTNEQALSSVDDELRLQGEFCTSPAANVVYPVKIMFIVDGSGSQQFTDQNRQRVVAVSDTIQELIGSGNVFFKILVFNSSVTATPKVDDDLAVFTNNLAELQAGLDNIAQADTVTDYQGALSVAYSELVRDMESVRTDPLRGFAELGRSKYVLVFMSDGFPDPQCKVGLGNDFASTAVFADGINHLCEDSSYLACILHAGTCADDGSLCRSSAAPWASGAECENEPICGPSAENGGAYVCTPQPPDPDNNPACYADEDPTSLFGGLGNMELTAGSDYNQPYQILKKVQDIMDLEERYELGEIRVDSALVLDPLASADIIAIFGDTTQAIPLMKEIAETGNGDYLEFYGGDTIDFGSLNFDSLKQTRVLRSFFVQAISNRLAEGGLLADTDFDGLVDTAEYDAGTDPLLKDTDGDGYNDYLENTRRGYGYDPVDPCLPSIMDMSHGGDASNCDAETPSTWVNCDHQGVGAGAVYYDDDFDGLNNCEERAIGTEVLIVDSDSDGLIDIIDYVAGLSPTTWDYDSDVDQDSIPNGREIEWHLNPLVYQSDIDSRDRYRYVRDETSTTIDGRICYTYDVRHIHLGQTGASEDLTPITVGMNEVRLYILENMSDNMSGVPLVRVACVRPRYVPPTLKIPSSGEANVSDPIDDDTKEIVFKYLATQDPIADELNDEDYFDASVDCQVLQ